MAFMVFSLLQGPNATCSLIICGSGLYSFNSGRPKKKELFLTGIKKVDIFFCTS